MCDELEDLLKKVKNEKVREILENNFYLCTRKVPVMSTIASRCTIKRRIWSLREISATFLLSFEKLFGDGG